MAFPAFSRSTAALNCIKRCCCPASRNAPRVAWLEFAWKEVEAASDASVRSRIDIQASEIWVGSESGERGKDLAMDLSWETRFAMGDDILGCSRYVVLEESL